ncbi:MAG: amidase family protein [Thermoflexales bacterium]
MSNTPQTAEDLIRTETAQSAENLERQYNTPAWAGPRPLVFPADIGAPAALPDERWATVSLAGLRAGMDVGTITSLGLVRRYIERIRRLDAGRLNSVIELNPNAFTDAQARDAEPARGPLHGIPILLKDNIGVAGPMRTTAGAWALRDAVCDRDSAVAARLRAAGAVLLGKANLSEWANWTTDGMPNGFSSVGGQTHNPHGRFEVSGSSSGSAVAVAAGLCAAAIGSETWGSLVAPASANGVVTLKPSLGLVSRDRIIPITEATDTAGPLARSVADLAAVLDGIAGPDPADPETEAARSLAGMRFSARLDPDGLRGKRVGIVRQTGDIDPDAPAWRERLAAALRAAGATVVETTPQALDETRFRDDFMTVAYYDFKRGVNAYLAATGAPMTSLAEIVAFNAADAANRAPWGQTLLAASEAHTVTPEAYAGARARNRAAARARIDELLHAAGCDLLAGTGSASYIPFAMAGAPALTLPLGRRDTGEPMGATLIGRFLEDGELVAAGYGLESALGVNQPRG